MADPNHALATIPQQVQEVLARYEAGEQVRDICQSYGVSHVTIYKRVIAHAEDAWKEIQVARALARKEAAEDEMDTATDVITIARARERLRSAQWDLERVCRRIYGQDAQTVLGSGQVSISINFTQSTEPKLVNEQE